MKKLFKWVALCLALMLAFGIAACSKEGEVAQSESAAFIAAVEEIGYIQRGYENFEEKISAIGGKIELVDSEREAAKFRLRVG